MKFRLASPRVSTEIKKGQDQVKTKWVDWLAIGWNHKLESQYSWVYLQHTQLSLKQPMN